MGIIGVDASFRANQTKSSGNPDVNRNEFLIISGQCLQQKEESLPRKPSSWKKRKLDLVAGFKPVEKYARQTASFPLR